MGKPKAASKEAAQTTRAPKKEKRTAVPAHLLVPVDAGDWPTNLDDKKAEALFKAIEGGKFPNKAAKELGLEPATVRQWKHRHPKFAQRIEEAEAIGKEGLVEEMDEFADGVMDRDGAAAAKARLECRLEAMRHRWPRDFRVSPFKPAGENGDKGLVVGVVVLPPLQQPASPERPPIEGEAKRVAPSEPAVSATAFRLTRDGH